MQTCIKICGLTTREDVKACIDLGANWVGFNCYPLSKRYIVPEKIHELIAGIPPEITTVGIFVNESLERVNQVVAETGIQMVQLHGDETPQFAAALTARYFRAFRVSPDFHLDSIQQYSAPHFLLDSYHSNLYGGTGNSFNWEIAYKAKHYGQLILSGGLTPENIEAAITQVHPFGVDVCSGVEISPGVKDLQLVENFIQVVRNLDHYFLMHPPHE